MIEALGKLPFAPAISIWCTNNSRRILRQAPQVHAKRAAQPGTESPPGPYSFNAHNAASHWAGASINPQLLLGLLDAV